MAQTLVESILFVVAIALLTSCATTRQTRSVETSGFLRDYSQLREGEGEEAQLVYVDPTGQWSSYDAVMIDSVTIWQSEGTNHLSGEDE